MMSISKKKINLFKLIGKHFIESHSKVQRIFRVSHQILFLDDDGVERNVIDVKKKKKKSRM